MTVSLIFSSVFLLFPVKCYPIKTTTPLLTKVNLTEKATEAPPPSRPLNASQEVTIDNIWGCTFPSPVLCLTSPRPSHSRSSCLACGCAVGTRPFLVGLICLGVFLNGPTLNACFCNWRLSFSSVSGNLAVQADLDQPHSFSLLYSIPEGT